MRTKASTAVHHRYRNKAGVVVPGVTTVIALLAKPALISWAWKLGLEGQDMNKVRDNAANIGTLTHYMCECLLKGERQDISEYAQADIDVALPMYKSFRQWLDLQGLKLVESEYSVVSEDWQFGGCIDMVAMADGGDTRGLFDIKTSKGIYDEYKIQMAAYEAAWNECRPLERIDQIRVIHLDKETGLLEVHPFGDLHVEFEIFKHLRAIYVLQKKADPKRRNEVNTKGKRLADSLK